MLGTFPPDALSLARLKYSDGFSALAKLQQNKINLIFKLIKPQTNPRQVVNLPFSGQRCLSPGENPKESAGLGGFLLSALLFNLINRNNCTWVVCSIISPSPGDTPQLHPGAGWGFGLCSAPRARWDPAELPGTPGCGTRPLSAWGSWGPSPLPAALCSPSSP